MSDNSALQIHNLTMDYRYALDEAKRFGETKKGVKARLRAADIQRKLAAIRTDDPAAAADHNRRADELATEATTMAVKIGLISVPAPASEPAPSSEPAPASVPSTSVPPSAKRSSVSDTVAGNQKNESAKSEDKELHGFDPESTRVAELPTASFDDYGSVSAEIQNIIDALELAYQRENYPNLNALMPPGKLHILLYGPPGGGKSHMIKAIGNYAMKTLNSTFYMVNASDIKHSLVGVSEKRLKALFDLIAKDECALPVLCVDEIDSIVPPRDGDNPAYVRSLVTEFLQKIEGVAGSTRAIIVAATNYPWNVDPAMRSRLPKRAFVDLPNEAQVKSFLQRNMVHYIADADMERLISMCAQSLVARHASYRDLNNFIEKISTDAFFVTVRNNPDNKLIDRFDSVSEDHLQKILTQIYVDYDATYIRRLKNPELWNNPMAAIFPTGSAAKKPADSSDTPSHK